MSISHIINGSHPVTGDIALRLGRYLGQSPQFWMNLQSNFDMQTAEVLISKSLFRPKNAVLSSKRPLFFDLWLYYQCVISVRPRSIILLKLLPLSGQDEIDIRALIKKADRNQLKTLAQRHYLLPKLEALLSKGKTGK